MTKLANDDGTLRYYHAEMHHLREEGAAFGRQFPERVRTLHDAREDGRDPHVERMFEGFAFLLGRLRRKLDDELPELSDSIAGVVWPHDTRVLPSLAIIEVAPSPGKLVCPRRLAAGLEVSLKGSAPDPAGACTAATGGCIYRTTQTVDLYPLSLVDASNVVREDGRPVVRLRFAIEPQAQRDQLNVPKLRMYLNAERPVAFALYAALTAKATKVQLRLPAGALGQRGLVQPMPALRLEGAAFSAHEPLRPKVEEALAGHRLMQEYFAFQEKFLFVDLLCLDLRALPVSALHFDIEIEPADSWPNERPIHVGQIRLHCTPVVNLFEVEADPVEVTQCETGYPVRARRADGVPVEIYSVDAVHGFDAGRGERFGCTPFASRSQSGDSSQNDTLARDVDICARRSQSGSGDTWIVVGGSVWEHAGDLQRAILSLKVTGTDSESSVSELRRGGGIQSTCSEAAGIVSTRNLTVPTAPVHPSMEQRDAVFTRLDLCHRSLLDVNALRRALSSLNWTDDELNRRRIEAIVDVKHRSVQSIVRGALMRGVDITITLNRDGFTCEGDLLLFGAVLRQFFGLQAALNLYTRLSAVVRPTGRRLEWPAWPDLQNASCSGAPC